MTFYVLRHHTFQQHHVHKDFFDRVLLDGMNAKEPYQSICDIKVRLMKSRLPLPSISTSCLVGLLLCTMCSAMFLMNVYRIKKDQWLSQLENTKQYLILLPYEYENVSIYQRYLLMKEEETGEQGKKEALRELVSCIQQYDLPITLPVIQYLIREAIHSQDVSLMEEVRGIGQSYTYDDETHCIMRMIENLHTKQEIDPTIFLDTSLQEHWGESLLILCEKNMEMFSIGYEEGISLCESLEAMLELDSEKLIKVKERFQFEEARSYEFGVVDEVYLEQLNRQWNMEEPDNIRHLAILYTEVFLDFTLVQRAEEHLEMLHQAQALYAKLKQQQPQDGSIDAAIKQIEGLLEKWEG